MNKVIIKGARPLPKLFWIIVLSIGIAVIFTSVRLSATESKPKGIPFDRSLHEFNLTSGFWAKRSYGIHYSWDCALPEGTPIYAIMPGKVHVKANKEAGLMIIIENGDWIVGYYHLMEPNVLSKQEVNYGTLIGFSGNSGSESTGPHIHYFIERKGIRQNPNNFVK